MCGELTSDDDAFPDCQVCDHYMGYVDEDGHPVYCKNVMCIRCLHIPEVTNGPDMFYCLDHAGFHIQGE